MSSRGHFSEGVPFAGDALLAIGAGKVPTVDHSTLQAQTTGLDIGGQDMIDWATEYIWPSDSGEAMSIASTDAADTVPVLVVGLDTEFLPKQVVVVLTGVTPVGLGTFTRINLITTLGTVPTIGIVDVTGSGNTYCRMNPDKQISSMGVYTSPAGKASQILSLFASIIRSGGNADAELEASLYFRPPNSVFKWAVGFTLQRRGTTTIGVDNTIPRAIEGPTDHVFRALPSATNMTISLRMAFLLQDV